MKQFLVLCSLVAVLTGVTAFAGALRLEVGNPAANTEAKALHALAVARVSSCHEPAKSVVTANAVRMVDGKPERTKLNVIPLKSGDTFAIVGSIPGAENAVLELAVTNPEFQNYEPRVLIRRDTDGMQWASQKQFFSVPPTAADLKAVLEQ